MTTGDQTDELHDRFETFMAEFGLQGQGACIVGVSGGPDSMALTGLLSRFMNKAAGAVHAITIDHGLRSGSADEAAVVSRWLAGWPCVSHETVRWVGEKPSARIMEQARLARLGLLREKAMEKGLSHVFLAHHRGDQAETLLARLAKGSGLDGLCGMRAIQDWNGVSLVRPLLGEDKNALLSFCKKYNIPFVLDPSNENAAYLRPRLRNIRQLLDMEGLTDARLAVTARRLGMAREALDYYAERAFRDALAEQGDESCTLRLAVLASHPAETRLRVVRMVVDALRPGKDYPPRLERLEPLVAQAFSGAPFRRRTLGGLVFSVSSRKDELRVEKES